MRLPVLIAAGGAAWEADLVAALDAGTTAVAVARRCVDVVDLLAVAAAGQGRAALIASSLRRFDADAVDRLRAADVVPVGVVPRGDTDAEDRMHALGVDHLVPADADAAVVASVLVAAVEDAERADPAARSSRVFGDPATSLAVPPRGVDPDPERGPTRQGTVVAVWGPAGAPGRTTVAITLADELARLVGSSLLVDADVYGGTVAAELGLLDESPGLAAACRLAAGTRLDGPALAGLCWQLRADLRVLTGIPLASRWPELRPTAVTAVLAAARQLAEHTVVDCGFCLETDEELSFDSLAPRRNGATLAVLDEADCVVVVGAADPDRDAAPGPRAGRVARCRDLRTAVDRAEQVAARCRAGQSARRAGRCPGTVRRRQPGGRAALRPGVARRGAGVRALAGRGAAEQPVAQGGGRPRRAVRGRARAGTRPAASRRDPDPGSARIEGLR